MESRSIPEVNQDEFSELMAENRTASLKTIAEIQRLIKDLSVELCIDLEDKNFGINTQSTILRAINDKVKEVLEQVDQVKEEACPIIGVKLDDGKEKTTYKYCEPRRIADIREEREKKLAEERARKEKEAEELRKKEEEKEMARKNAKLPPPLRNGHPIHPSEYYRSLTQFFSVWDETGFPVCDDEGNQISDERMEEIMKDWRQIELDYNLWRNTHKEQEDKEEEDDGDYVMNEA